VIVRIATRGSDLALWQANTVAGLLREAVPGADVSVRTFTTRGDRETAPRLSDIGGEGLFTAEVDRALLDREADIAVHSLKDLPIETPEGLLIMAVPSRGPVEDALVTREGVSLADLANGAVVGTSSPRRAAFLRSVRPDLQIVNLRGNLATRLDRVASGDLDGTVLARAGLERLGLGNRISEILGPPQLLPAPGQGALAVVARADDDALRDAVTALDDGSTRLAVQTERAVLAGLGGGCSVPLGVLAENDGASWRVASTLFGDDGTRHDDARSGTDPAELAAAAARALLEKSAVP
jgi:hydroxymethylbilane synthase